MPNLLGSKKAEVKMFCLDIERYVKGQQRLCTTWMPGDAQMSPHTHICSDWSILITWPEYWPLIGHTHAMMPYDWLPPYYGQGSLAAGHWTRLQADRPSLASHWLSSCLSLDSLTPKSSEKPLGGSFSVAPGTPGPQHNSGCDAHLLGIIEWKLNCLYQKLWP